MVSEGTTAGGKWVEDARCLRMPRLGVGHLNHSWRIGKLYCQFLRDTYGYDGEGMPDILSPFEMPKPCSIAELALVLGARLRFVARFHEELYCRWMRGRMLLDTRAVGIPMPLRYSEGLRNAGSVCIFAVGDGFTRLGNGMAANSFLIKNEEFVVGVLDESHQLDFHLVALAATLQGHLFLLLDPAQRI